MTPVILALALICALILPYAPVPLPVFAVVLSGLIVAAMASSRRRPAPVPTSVPDAPRPDAPHDGKAKTEIGLILEAIPSILIGVSGRGTINHWNSAAERAFGIAGDQVVGKPFDHCGIPLDWNKVLTYRDESVGQSASMRLDDMRYELPDGRSGYLGITLISLPGGNGSAGGGFLMFAADITERRQREAQSIHSIKLVGIGQLAAGIAHEINTPVQFIGDNLSFLGDVARHLYAAETGGSPCVLEKLIAGAATPEEIAALDVSYHKEEVPKAIAQSSEGIRRVGTIVSAMKDFSHPDGAEPELFEINRCITTAAGISRNEYKLVADLVLDLDPDTGSAKCYPGDLNQVFLNLIVNSAHAVSDAVRASRTRGTITISSRRKGDWIEVRVADTGAGIPEGVQPRLFEPFFTTKEVGRGTGQGLYICREIITKKHAGTITFVSVVGAGTTFTIRIPAGGTLRRPRAEERSAAFRTLMSTPPKQ
ncbi:MAG: PAS domain-containing sensor histidine kinase [Planctomycetes bacterium]|nr:PAS domain-containing sensor histidine kinase [Planctomycetota bacterium]